MVAEDSIMSRLFYTRSNLGQFQRNKEFTTSIRSILDSAGNTPLIQLKKIFSGNVYASLNDEFDFAQQTAALMDDQERFKNMCKIGRQRAKLELAWPFQEERLLIAYKILVRKKEDSIT
jgi:hypothetical protein